MTVTADAFVFLEEDDEWYYLEIERGKHPFKNSPGIPGGHVEDDERPEDAIPRELEEETGITEEATDVLTLVELPNGRYIEEKSDLIFDPRYEGSNEAEYREIMNQKDFEEDEIEWIIDNMGEVEARNGDFEYYASVFIAEGELDPEGTTDANDAYFKKYSERPEYMTFGQQRALEWAHDQIK